MDEIFWGKGDLHPQVRIVIKGRDVCVDEGIEELILTINNLGLETVLSCIDQDGMTRVMIKDYDRALLIFGQKFVEAGKTNLLGTKVLGFNSMIEVAGHDTTEAGIVHPKLAKNVSKHLGIEFKREDMKEVLSILKGNKL